MDVLGVFTWRFWQRGRSRFHRLTQLYLPVAALDTVNNRSREANPEEQKQPSQSLHILVADDEPLIREICQTYLEKLGHTGIFVEDGRETVSEINPDVKVIISSGFIADNSVAELKQSGVKAIIDKPFKLAELKRCIDELGANN